MPIMRRANHLGFLACICFYVTRFWHGCGAFSLTRTSFTSSIRCFRLNSCSEEPDWSIEKNEKKNDLEELMASTLAAVLYPSPNGTEIDVEKAVSRTIRRHGGAGGLLADNGRRARFSQSVIGASVMRRRLYALIPSQDLDTCSGPEDQQKHDRALAMLRVFESSDAPTACNGLDADDLSFSHIFPKTERIATQYSLPSWLAETLVRQYGTVAAADLARASNKPGPISLRRNRVLCGEGLSALANRLSVESGLPVRVGTVGRHLGFETGVRFDLRLSGAAKIAAAQDDSCGVGGGNSSSSSIGSSSNNYGRRARPSTIYGLGAWQEGWCEVQDQGSQLVVAAVCEAIDDLAYFDTAVVDDDNNLMDRNSFTVLDLCAGNGGKALGIASHLANRTPRPASGTDREESGRVQSGLEARRTIGEVKKGERVEDQGGRLSRQAHAGWERRVLCYDVNANRLKQIAGSLHRAGLAPSGLSGVQVQVLYSEAELEAAACPRSVDVALVDAPCSSTGALRRHPSLRWSMGLKRSDFANEVDASDVKVKQDRGGGGGRGGEEGARSSPPPPLPALQRKLLQRAATTVRVGGALVYATCSVLQSENQDIVRWFDMEGDSSGEWEPWPFTFSKATIGEQDMEDGGEFDDFHPGRYYKPVSRSDAANFCLPAHCIATLPHLHGCDGFFIARWRRSALSGKSSEQDS